MMVVVGRGARPAAPKATHRVSKEKAKSEAMSYDYMAAHIHLTGKAIARESFFAAAEKQSNKKHFWPDVADLGKCAIILLALWHDFVQESGGESKCKEANNCRHENRCREDESYMYTPS